MIRFHCECGQQLQGRDEHAGKIVRCPACQRQVRVPNQPASAIQPEEPVEQAPSRARVQRERPAPRDEVREDEERPSRRRATSSSGKALASLILGILSSCGCTCLTGLPSLVLGFLALRDISRAAGTLTGKPLAFIGMILGCIGTLCMPIGYYFAYTLAVKGTTAVQEAANRATSVNNLKQIAIAMHNYHDLYGSFPPPGLGDPAQPAQLRKANLSWRVALLPLVEEIQLYQQFKLNEPWDSPNNIKLLARMPKVYKIPGDDKIKPDHTRYQVFVGNLAIFDKTQPRRMTDITDGTSNTILVAEAETPVPWTKPDDIPFEPGKPIKPLLSTLFRSGCNVAMADGFVRTIPPDTPETTLQAMITRGGGEIVKLP